GLVTPNSTCRSQPRRRSSTGSSVSPRDAFDATVAGALALAACAGSPQAATPGRTGPAQSGFGDLEDAGARRRLGARAGPDAQRVARGAASARPSRPAGGHRRRAGGDDRAPDRPRGG